MFRSKSIALTAVCGWASLIAASTSYGHFVWLKTITEKDQPHAYLFFGETVADEAYHVPEKLADIEVYRRAADGQRAKLETVNLEEGERVGLIAPLGGDEPYVLEATRTYGIYGKSLLVYYAKHVDDASGQEAQDIGRSEDLKLDIVPKKKGDELELTVFWQGKPLAGANVSISVGDAEAVKETTNEQGTVSLKPEGDGIVAALANYEEKGEAGEWEGKKYESVLHYASLTLGSDAPKEQSEEKVSTSSETQSSLPSLPEPVSSFGGVVADGWLYVYSGHTGEEHQHSSANLSKHFRRIKLEGGTEWEELPIEVPLQGLPLVAHDGKIYRVGGLDARNATTDDDEDLHSTAEFSEFDPATKKWQSLAPLPAPRSSHNAVVIGDRLFVVGGWHLHGESPGDWQVDALVYNFAKPEAGWQKLPEPPFKRRALAVAEWQGKLVAIGGMDDNAKISQRVDIFDPAAGKWSQGPDLPGSGMSGFGSSACSVGDQLFASGLRGIVYRLDDAGSAWEEAARLGKPRFFHQLLPAGGEGLLAVAGASMDGHLADIELIDVSDEPSDKRETAKLSSASGAEAL